MRGLTAHEVVELWERGLGLGHASRAMAMLQTAEDSIEAAVLPVSLRDARLLELRSMTFGERLEILTGCPLCNARVELVIEVGALNLKTEPTSMVGQVDLDIHGHEVSLRVVTAEDLVTIEESVDLETARRALIKRCVSAIDGCEPASVPEELGDAIETALEDLDERAITEVCTFCPECNEYFVLPFDPARFLWQELEAHARRLLGEVAALASAYHWSERDILSMSAARRRFYLEAAG